MSSRSSLRLDHAQGEILRKLGDFVHDGSDFCAIETDGARQIEDRRLVGLLQPDVFVELLRGREDHQISRLEFLISLLEACYSVGNLPFERQVGARIAGDVFHQLVDNPLAFFRRAGKVEAGAGALPKLAVRL